MKKKELELQFELQYIPTDALDKRSEYPNLVKEYDVAVSNESFPICYLEQEIVKETKVEPTTVLHNPDQFVSPIIGVQDNGVKSGDQSDRPQDAYKNFFNQTEVRPQTKQEIKREFDLSDSKDYREMLINGVRPHEYETKGYTVEEEYDGQAVYNSPLQEEYVYEEVISKQEEIKPIYEEPVQESTYEYETPVVEDVPTNTINTVESYEEPDVTEYFDEPAPKKAEPVVTPKVEPRRTHRSRYMAPPVNLINHSPVDTKKDSAWAEQQKAAINSVFQEFKYGAKAFDYIVGPTVTLFLIDIEPGTDVSRISSFTKSLTMRLRAKTLRIQDPIPGLGCAGIEIPNENRATVLVGNFLTKDFLQTDKKLKFVLGLNLNGEMIYGDIDKMPHGLVAGSTGSGKSVCLNTMLVSLLYHNSPDELRFIMIDPKMVEFSFYENIPHLAMPVITEAKKAVTAFKWACEEMDRRYEVFRFNHVRDLKGFNFAQMQNGGRIMPQIIIVVDELADLMSVAGSEIEDYVLRLGAKARAAGIHVILATQRPSVDVVKGTMKNNIPTRIAFRVQSPQDSITILNHAGAETLLGNGDMLYSDDLGEQRIQGPYLSDQEIMAVCNYLADNNEQNFLIDSKQLEEKIVTEEAEEEDDEKFEEICYYAVRNEIGSANRLMQVFNISFNRANRILLKMERLGILSSTVKGKQREVLVSADELADILDNDK